MVIEDVDDDEEDEEGVFSSLGWRIWEDDLASTGADPSIS